MGTRERFEDLRVWQLAINLAADIFSTFKDSKTFSIKNQIERAAVSISTNIAEGYEQGTDKHFVKYLYIAKGSCGEVRSLLRLSVELNLISSQKANILINNCTKLSVYIYNLIKSRSKSINE